jgi:multicomponent Na+:H+ antiporter subunit E
VITRRRGLRYSVAATAWLTAVWVMLWGDLSAANVLAGVVLALVVGLALRMPSVHFTGRVHLVPLARLLVVFARDLVVASIQVVRMAFWFGRLPHSAVIAVQLRSPVDLYLTLTAELTSLVPGSIVVEAHRTTGMLYVHVLDVGISHGLAAARQHVLDNEARVLRALASDAELRAAGLARNPKDPPPGRAPGVVTRPAGPGLDGAGPHGAEEVAP